MCSGGFVFAPAQVNWAGIAAPDLNAELVMTSDAFGAAKLLAAPSNKRKQASERFTYFLRV